MLSTLKPGIVPYLNVLPLIEGLEEFFPPPVVATPRELADLLLDGTIDFATLPVFDLLQKGHMLLPHCAIAADGPVRSVKIFSHNPINDTKTLLLDRSSLTSIALCRILCAEHLQISPQYILSDEPLKPRPIPEQAADHAILAIGDTALAWEDSFPHSYDLAEGWKALTGLPFVFAAWTALKDREIPSDAVDALQQCRRRGERSAYEIATREAGRHDREVRDIVDYLSRSIRYRMGETELQALELYRLKLVKHELLPAETPPVNVWNPPAVTDGTACTPPLPTAC